MESGTQKAIWLGARRVFWFILLFSCGVNILMLTAPLYMLQVYDRVLSSGSGETLLFLSLIAVVALVVLGVLDMMRRFAMIRMGNWIDRSLAAPILSWTISSTARSKSSPSTRMVRDVSTVRAYLAGEAPFALMDIPWVIVFVTIVFVLHTWLGLVALAGAILLLVLVAANQLTTRKAALQANAASTREMQKTESIVRNADVIEAMGMKSEIARVYQNDKGQVLDLNRSFGEGNTFYSVTTKFLRMGLQVAILGVGALLAIRGDITPGAMIAGSILMGRALAPIELAVGSWRQSLNALEAFRRLKVYLVDMDHDQQMDTLPEPDGILSVDGIAYLHPGQTEPTLMDLNFRLNPGEMLGVIGPMGTGKSTLARILVGLTAPTRGHVRLDGAALADWNHEEVGPHLGYLPQNVDLIAGTVAQNVSRFHEGREAEMFKAAREVGMHEIILQLKGGYDAFVGEGGEFLSGGQRQRVGLARALFGEPRLLVFDEPNANLDRVGETSLIQALNRLKADKRTLVVISHRPRILEMADQILVLMPGGQSRIGPRDEVLAEMGAPRNIAAIPREESD